MNKTQVMVTFISAERAAYGTSRGPFAHLLRIPLRWQARDVAVAMSEMSVANIVWNYVSQNTELRIKIWSIIV